MINQNKPKPNPFHSNFTPLGDTYGYGKLTPEQKQMVDDEMKRRPNDLFGRSMLSSDLLNYGSFEAARAERQRQRDRVAKAAETRERKKLIPGYLYIYRAVIDDEMLYTFMLEPDREGDLELFRYIWAETGAIALFKELKSRFTGRKRGEFYHLSKKQVESLLTISSGKAPQVEEKPLVAPEPIYFENGKPTYGNARVSRKRDGYVYVLKQIGGDYYKIGRTSNPDNRRETFNVKLPFRVEYEIVIKTDDMYLLERQLHSRFNAKWIDGEWFQLSPDDLEAIRSITQ